MTDLAPGAEGWLGSTGGVTDDGTFVALARFESQEAAMRNSDRPEQGKWWSGMEALFTSEPEFRNSSEVEWTPRATPRPQALCRSCRASPPTPGGSAS